MNGGEGPHSYAQNSHPQRQGLEQSKALIDEAIIEKLDIKHDSSTSNVFRIVDLGCSVGPNTFLTVQNIIEAVQHKYQSQDLSSHIPEFQVFFNDHTSTDFNTLFTTLPSERRYFAAGAPGSFHGRLFPKASLHFINSSFAAHWLSKVPKEVVDVNSSAWNKGRIHYTNASREVGEAYSAQFSRDMESFLSARAEELVPGGLMMLLLSSRPDKTLPTQYWLNPFMEPLESCLMDMVNEGVLSEAKVNSFNFPIYSASPVELETLVQRNGCFSIERMKPMDYISKKVLTAEEVRAGSEGLISKHFGSEIMDELFDRYAKKIKSCSQRNSDDDLSTAVFILLKRKVTY